MDLIIIILNEGPGSTKSWNGLRLAGGMIGVDMKVKIFLLDEGVYCAKKGQSPIDGLKEQNLGKRIKELIEMGADVDACGVCIEAKGLTKGEMIEGVSVSSMIDLAKSIKESKQVLVF
jgi:sulfur relay (sulfurtransferase) complex TusBCD TusD component (DsrE family)